MTSFINLFRDLAPVLAKRKRNNEIEPCRSEGLPGPGEETLNRIREISVRELARLKEFPVIVDVGKKKNFTAATSKMRAMPAGRRLNKPFQRSTQRARAREDLRSNSRSADLAVAEKPLLEFGHLEDDFHCVPEGRARIARRFIAGLARNMVCVPEGRLNLGPGMATNPACRIKSW